jgi:hypothetical protein
MQDTPNPPPWQPDSSLTDADKAALARLLAGVDPPFVSMDRLSGVGRAIVDQVLNANGAGALAAFEAAIQMYPDKEQLYLAVLNVDPHAAAPSEKPPRYRFITATEMLTREPPKALIGGMFYLDSVTGIIGGPGTYKSFEALDLNLTVASDDLEFHDRTVEHGPTAYLIGEGTAGLRLRLEAWQKVRGPLPQRAYFLPTVPQLTDDADLAELLRAIRQLPAKPISVVVDTLARAMVGRDENSAKDMGLLVRGADMIRAETGACVTFVHHVNRAEGKIRGHSALPGGLDTLIKMDRQPGAMHVTVSCDKQKDAVEFTQFTLYARVVSLENGYSSLILERGTEDDTTSTQLSDTDARVYAALETFGEEGLASSVWWRLVEEEKVCSEPTFHRARRKLKTLGKVVQGAGDRGRYWPWDKAPA